MARHMAAEPSALPYFPHPIARQTSANIWQCSTCRHTEVSAPPWMPSMPPSAVTSTIRQRIRAHNLAHHPRRLARLEGRA